MQISDENKENTDKKNINGAECERKQGNDDIRHCNNNGFTNPTLYS